MYWLKIWFLQSFLGLNHGLATHCLCDFGDTALDKVGEIIVPSHRIVKIPGVNTQRALSIAHGG